MTERHYGALLDGAGAGIADRLDASTRRVSVGKMTEPRTFRPLAGQDAGGPSGTENAEPARRAGSRGERLMGFEPATFCMASRACGADSARIRLQRGGFWDLGREECFPAFTGRSRGFG